MADAKSQDSGGNQPPWAAIIITFLTTLGGAFAAGWHPWDTVSHKAAEKTADAVAAPASPDKRPEKVGELTTNAGFVFLDKRKPLSNAECLRRLKAKFGAYSTETTEKDFTALSFRYQDGSTAYAMCATQNAIVHVSATGSSSQDQIFAEVEALATAALTGYMKPQ